MRTCHYCKTDNSNHNGRHCYMCRRPLVKDNSGRHTASRKESEQSALAPSLIGAIIAVFHTKEDGTVKQIHEGVVVQETTKALRIYAEKQDAGSAEAQFYSIHGQREWCTVLSYPARRELPPPALR